MNSVLLNRLCPAIDALLAKKQRVIVAIDGCCTAGKTTLAQALAAHYDCNVVHMDDFFLRPEQRTPERLAQIGGNVDYERFHQEVLLPLLSGEAFSYRPYDCHRGILANAVPVTPKQLTIVEGSYSHHPYFGAVYDLTVFLTIDPEAQRQRILARPAHLHQQFFQQWAPMEQAYFDHFAIQTQSDIVLRTD